MHSSLGTPKDFRPSSAALCSPGCKLVSLMIRIAAYTCIESELCSNPSSLAFLQLLLFHLIFRMSPKIEGRICNILKINHSGGNLENENRMFRQVFHHFQQNFGGTRRVAANRSDECYQNPSKIFNLIMVKILEN